MLSHTPYSATNSADDDRHASFNGQRTLLAEYVEGDDSYGHESEDEDRALLHGQRISRTKVCGCHSCPACFVGILGSFKTAVKKIYTSPPVHLTVAAIGGTTALNGALKAHARYADMFWYDVVMALIAWAAATWVNYKASPVKNAKLMLEQGERLAIGPACSGIAAICSGFLATVAPVNIVNIGFQMLKGSAASMTEGAFITYAGWPLVLAGLFILTTNTYTSWNVGNMATASFIVGAPEIQQHFKEMPVITICAIIFALIANLMVTTPYVDGIADTIAGIASTEGGFLDRLQYMFFGSAGAKVDNETLYSVLYWAIFGTCLPANLVSLTTFTFMPSYRFFFRIFSMFSTLHSQLTEVIMKRETAGHDSWSSWIWVTILTTLFTFSYGAAFGGFTASTLSSPNWAWAGLSKDGATITGFIAAAVTWGPTLYEAGKNIFNPSSGARDPYYLMMQEYLTFLDNDANFPDIPREQRCLVLTENEATRVEKLVIAPKRQSVIPDGSNKPKFGNIKITHPGQFQLVVPKLYRDNTNCERLTREYTSKEDAPSRHAMIELMSQFFSNEALMECYDRSMDKLKYNTQDGQIVCHAHDKTFTLEKVSRTLGSVPVGVFSCDATYKPKGKIRLRIYLSTATPAHEVVDMGSPSAGIQMHTFSQMAHLAEVSNA